jgi:hypothetical protein
MDRLPALRGSSPDIDRIRDDDFNARQILAVGALARLALRHGAAPEG